jgi:ribosomal-protein-alanine N-acetyltransferase
MEKKDVAAVHEASAPVFRSPWSKMALQGELRNDVAHYLVMETDGVICGYGGMWVIFEEAT